MSRFTSHFKNRVRALNSWMDVCPIYLSLSHSIPEKMEWLIPSPSPLKRNQGSCSILPPACDIPTLPQQRPTSTKGNTNMGVNYSRPTSPDV
ncbi:hypothetical protein DSO57_1013417 [Entomophthora muscae]|uniref:Uncharacterized protein n=1 Tax=Entomophthora muscae TaxID=34485 RepID=A0ACC2TSN1_9FUNG|nr:hypothetical protein DSO57_1013417 [Entomophthora muscae]